MKTKSVVIRISNETRLRLKTKFPKAGYKTMSAYVEALSKLTIPEKNSV